MLQPGNYNGKITAAETVLSAKKIPMVRIDLEVTYVNQDGGWVEMDTPEAARMFLSTSVDAMEYTKKKLEFLKFRGDYTQPLFDIDWVELTCTHEDYKGKPQERWELTGVGSTAQPAGDDATEKLSALWRAEHPQHATPVGAPASPPAQPAAQPAAPPSAQPPAEAPDEVPF